MAEQKRRIFISYRREDSEDITGRLHDGLEAKYGRDGVFMDIDNIPFGEDFRERIEASLADTDIVLAMMGPGWLDKIRARANEPNDFVRIELETAHRLGARVMPVLIKDATIPNQDDLPETLRVLNLPGINAPRLRGGRDFRSDRDKLISSIEQLREALQANREAEERARQEAEEQAKRRAEKDARRERKAEAQRATEEAAKLREETHLNESLNKERGALSFGEALGAYSSTAIGWIGVTFLGAAIPSMIIMATDPDFVYSKSLLTGAIYGVSFGCVQWPLLHKKLVDSWWWIIASIPGWTIGWYVAQRISENHSGEANNYEIFFVAGAACGLIVGFAHWLHLVGQFKRAWTWIVATSLGWGIGNYWSVKWIDSLTLDNIWSVEEDITWSIFFTLPAGITMALALIYLFAHRKPS